jgi:hypothetical protein
VSIRNFVPEIWSANLLTALRKTLIYAGPGVVNRDYEGEIQEAGDTVRVTTVGRPKIIDYVPGQTKLVPEALNTGQRTLVVDQSKAFAFEVDDVDARQAMGNFIPEATDEAGYGLADIMDQYVANLYTAVPDAQRLDPVLINNIDGTETDMRKVYDQILVPLKVRLDELNVPTRGRYVIVPPWVHGCLIRDGRFIENDKSADASALRNGQVGRAAGFDILSSNNTPTPEANQNVVQAGTSRAITWAEQINKTEAYRPESSFADAVKGLALYGAKLFRPDSVACAVAQRQA